MYGYRFDYTSLLGSPVRNSSGAVVAARSALHVFTARVDLAAGDLGDAGGAGVELDLADAATLAWEAEVIGVMTGMDAEAREEAGVGVLVNVARR